MPKLILKTDRAEIWHVDGDYLVYRGVKLVRTCPSEGMAREIAAGL